MTETSALVIAAIIAGVVSIAVALIAGVVSFLSLVTSKEQSVSGFRQGWINALRKDIAIIAGRVTAIHGESIVKHKENQEILWERVKSELIGFNRVIVRIRLRLNPKEKAKKEKESTKAVLEVLKQLEEIFSSAKPRFNELKPLIDTLVNNAQIILKENWDRVRKGEPVYRNTLLAAKVLTLVGIILFICGGIYWFSGISR